VTYPACFDSHEQWLMWQAAARLAHPSPSSGYCEDCTPAYQAEMSEIDRCAYPNAVFVLNDAREAMGIRRRGDAAQ